MYTLYLDMQTTDLHILYLQSHTMELYSMWPIVCLFHKHNVFKIHLHCSMHQYLISFMYRYIHYMNTSHFVHTFICGRDVGCFMSLVLLWIFIYVWVLYFNSLGYIPRCKIAELHENSSFYIKLFYTVNWTISTFHQKCPEVPISSHPCYL